MKRASWSRFGVPLVAALTIGVLTSAAGGGVGVDVTMELTGNHVYVPVEVEGRGPYWFILDTGASRNVVDRGLARSLGLVEQDARVVRRGAGGEPTVIGSAADVEIVFAGTVQTGHIGIVALDSILAPFTGRTVHGILGAPIFERHRVTVDFAARAIRLDQPLQEPRAVTRVPIRINGGVPFAAARLGITADRSVATRVLVDLGARSMLLVARPFVDRHDLLTVFPDTREASLGAGIGGETRYHWTRATSLSVGDVVWSTPQIGLSDERTIVARGFDALLGTALLRRFDRATFDYKAGVLFLEGDADRRPEPFDGSGLFLVAPRGAARLEIRRVEPDTPASVAGIRVGDRIVTVNGEPAVRLGLDRVRRLLAGDAGTTVHLVIERSGRAEHITLVLEKLV